MKPILELQKNNMKEQILDAYGVLFEEKLIDEIIEVSELRTFEENDILIDFGQRINKMPLLLKGVIKILREDFDEGELLLYFIEREILAQCLWHVV
jgi:CRP/FNR family transcriptional regulator